MNSESSGRRKRVSARLQVKRLDQVSKEFALSKDDPAEETGFLRSVRIFRSAISSGPTPGSKSGPDVFADALVPRNPRSPGNVSFPRERPSSPERVVARQVLLRQRAEVRTAGARLDPLRPPFMVFCIAQPIGLHRGPTALSFNLRFESPLHAGPFRPARVGR